MPSITRKISPLSVGDLVNRFNNGQLNLEPGFQRLSVWKDGQRQKLIESVLCGYPLPAIFLYKRPHDGGTIYDVIDGKQRLETLFRFMGVQRGRFDARVKLPESEDPEWLGWRALKRRGLAERITSFELPVIEIDGDFHDIVEVFVRINSTGSALTTQEKRHARYYRSRLLKNADHSARKLQSLFVNHGILSDNQLKRMKHVELVCEIALSFHQGGVLNKKAVLDKVMSADSIDGRALNRALRQTASALKRVVRLCPDLHSTRFTKLADFYTLVVLVGSFEREGLILTDRRRNRLAADLLVAFGRQVDDLRLRQRKLETLSDADHLARDYTLTILEGTDQLHQRQRREQILRALLESLFARKDAQRGFTPEQRRIIWSSTKERTCQSCERELTWDDFTIDHINPHSKGGRSELANATLLCRRCNSAKGNRSAKRSRRVSAR
jgi:5-methylcytosine-specific restriction endonuclease McrA